MIWATTLDRLAIAVATTAVSLALGGCSGSDGGSGGKCSAAVVTGSPLLSSGTASVHGAGTLPSGIPDGQELELELDSGNFSVGVLPENIASEPLTCGPSFTYTISRVEAGTYSLDYVIFDPRSQSGMPTFSGTSTNTFVVTDGQSVEFDPTF